MHSNSTKMANSYMQAIEAIPLSDVSTQSNAWHRAGDHALDRQATKAADAD